MMKVQDICVSYDGKCVVSNFSECFETGRIVSIIGPNGSGKSTVLKAAARLIKRESGAVFLNGRDMSDMSIKSVARQLAILMQSNDCPASFTVRQLVQFGRLPHQKWYETADKDQTSVVSWAMDAAGVRHLEDRSVMSLSGGERQKVWIATALAQQPKILFLDEPTTFLDICHQLEVMNLIAQLNREHGLSVVMVLHDLNQAAQFSHKIIAIKKGEIYACGAPGDVINDAMLRDVYGVRAQISHNPATNSMCIVPVALVPKETQSTKGKEMYAV